MQSIKCKKILTDCHQVTRLYSIFEFCIQSIWAIWKVVLFGNFEFLNIFTISWMHWKGKLIQL
jgi:hypothetical protein